MNLIEKLWVDHKYAVVAKWTESISELGAFCKYEWVRTQTRIDNHLAGYKNLPKGVLLNTDWGIQTFADICRLLSHTQFRKL